MRRNALNDSWEYVELGKRISASEAQKNQTTYQMYKLLSIIMGVIICLLVLFICIALFLVLGGERITGFWEATITGAIALSSIQAGKSGYNYLLSLFGQRFLQGGLRPFFMVQGYSEDPYIGRVFRDSHNHIVTLCARSDANFYQTYYVKHGIQYQGNDIDKNHLEKVEFLYPDAKDVKTDTIKAATD